MTPDQKFYDVIVIGAGISGLYAACCLEREGLAVKVLEARDYVGGRSITLRSSFTEYVDMGGAYVGKQQTKLLEVINDLGLETYDVPSEGKSVLLINGQRVQFTEDNFPLTYLLTTLDFNNALQKLDSMSLEVSLLEPWRAAKAEEWDKISVQDFAHKLCCTDFTCRLLALAASTVYLHSAGDVSLLSFLREIRSCGGQHALFSSVKGLQGMKIKGGSSLVSEKLAERLKGSIRYNSPVRSIDHSGDCVKVTTHDDKIYTSRQVIVAVCPPVLQNIEVIPPLPEDTHQPYIQNCAEYSSFKTVMYYPEAYWQKKGLRGETISIDDDAVAFYTLPDTKYDGSHPAIMGFVDGFKYGKLTKEERKLKLCQYYARVFDMTEMLYPVRYVEKAWGQREPDSTYTGICVYSVPPGFLTKHKVLWGESCGKIHFAGAEASPVMHGYMDGALRSAEVATVKVLECLERTPQHEYDTRVRTIPYMPYPIIERLLPSVPQLFIGLFVLFVYIIFYCAQLCSGIAI